MSVNEMIRELIESDLKFSVLDVVIAKLEAAERLAKAATYLVYGHTKFTENLGEALGNYELAGSNADTQS